MLTPRQTRLSVFINHPEDWLSWPFLPLRNKAFHHRGPMGLSKLGFIVYKKWDPNAPKPGNTDVTVYIGNVFNIVEDGPSKLREWKQTISYKTVNAMLEDGWEID